LKANEVWAGFVQQEELAQEHGGLIKVSSEVAWGAYQNLLSR